MDSILLNKSISSAQLSFDNTNNMNGLRIGSAISVNSIKHDLFNAIITKITPKRIYAKILLNN